jgi:two-component system, LuxR family, sensor kinase FixL
MPHDREESAKVAAPALRRGDAKVLAPAEKRADASALETQTQLQQLSMMAACVESMPGSIVSFRLDRDGKGSFPYASANVEEFFGFSRVEASADVSTLRERIHPDDRERIDAAIAASATLLTRYHEEYRYLHPVKGTIWIEVQSSPTPEADGSIVWHGYVCDVTARKRAEEELRMSEARHRAFFDANLIGVCYANAKEAIITEANDKYLAMLGFSREDLEAGLINWKELTPPEFKEANDAAIAELLATGRNERHTEKEYIRKDGGRLPVLVARALLDRETFDGVAFVLDISEQKKNENRISEAHHDRLAVIRSMALGIAHEINQPLAATTTYLRVLPRLLKMKPEERPSSVRETIDKAVAQMMRAGEIIRRLRSFIAHGEPDKIRLHLHELILEAVESTLAGVNERKIAFSLELGASSDVVLADRVQITQVLINLIRNAKEAMEPTHERRLSISTRSTDSDITVAVADTGTGLCEKKRESLFMPFATTKASGMGIGLSISREIIEAHQGQIWGDSRLGGGAIFSFTLSLAEEEAE